MAGASGPTIGARKSILTTVITITIMSLQNTHVISVGPLLHNK